MQDMCLSITDDVGFIIMCGDTVSYLKITIHFYYFTQI